MKPSSEVQKIKWKRRVNLTLLSAFVCCSVYATPGIASSDSTLLIAQQNASPYQQTTPQYPQGSTQFQNAPPMQWQGQPPQTGTPAGSFSQWTGQPPANGQWAPPQGQGMGPPGGAPNQYPQYQGNAAPPQQWQGAPPQGMQSQPPQAMYGQPPNFSNSASTPNYGPPQGQYVAAPPYQQPQGQNWNYQNQQPNLQGQASQNYTIQAAPPPQNQVPTPPPNEGYPSMDELNQTFQQNPADNVQQPSTAAKVGSGLLNMVKNSMMTTPGMGMGGMGMGGMGMGGMGMGGMGMGGYGSPYGGGYGMPYGAAPMGYPMMGSPGLLGAPMGTMGSGNMMNNILNQGMRMFRF